MYQQISEENMQESLNRRRCPCNPGHINTPQRPYTSPLDNRQVVNGVSAVSERLYTSNPQDLNDHYGRAPFSVFHSTPVNSHIPYATYSECNPEVDSNLSCIPKHSPNLMIGQGEPRSHHSGYNKSHCHASSIIKTPNTKKKLRSESIMEWFDRTVEAELQKRRKGSLSIGDNLSPSSRRNASRPSNPVLYEASTAGIDIEGKLQPRQDTELIDAVDKLAKAEAMIAFEGAIKAAEEAAANAPPELAEEAAAAGAKDFQAELTGLVKQEFPGVKPIEVVGYVGITRPKKPRKSKFAQ